MSKYDDQINQLEIKLAILSSTLTKMEGRLAFLERDHAQATNAVDNDGVVAIPDGLIPRGKYKGQKHEDIVGADPWHVCWVADKGFAQGLGYTDEQIAEAKAYAATHPEPGRRR